MEACDVFVAIYSMERFNLCHEMLLVQLGECVPKDLAGIYAPTLSMSHQVHNSIIAMTQLRPKLVFLARILQRGQSQLVI